MEVSHRPAFSRLPLAIDPAPLLAALADLDETLWQPHSTAITTRATGAAWR